MIYRIDITILFSDIGIYVTYWNGTISNKYKTNSREISLFVNNIEQILF